MKFLKSYVELVCGTDWWLVFNGWVVDFDCSNLFLSLQGIWKSTPKICSATFLCVFMLWWVVVKHARVSKDMRDMVWISEMQLHSCKQTVMVTPKTKGLQKELLPERIIQSVCCWILPILGNFNLLDSSSQHKSSSHWQIPSKARWFSPDSLHPRQCLCGLFRKWPINSSQHWFGVCQLLWDDVSFKEL